MANKKKKCCHCKVFKNTETMIKAPNGSHFCSLDHQVSYAYQNKEKGRKIKHREQKRNFQLSDLKLRKKYAKSACHSYIRERDKNEKCICCGRELGKNYDAGHFIESGNNPAIRFHEDNIHAQSVYCNQYCGGNSDDYEGRLRAKIGDKRVGYLISQKGISVKRTAEDYLEIENFYKNKLKMLQSKLN